MGFDDLRERMEQGIGWVSLEEEPSFGQLPSTTFLFGKGYRSFREVRREITFT
jgi:hypothetical protein